ncbi:TniB family NTP-binding protein (plasmid) [Aminobacter sp. NyZ550]|nr:TniB family NTP-binding protein [Aminobacter sp. NyZ550]WAX98433.1 TniB family NTP-binding protein [Aminobacter sp. NyZ550]
MVLTKALSGSTREPSASLPSRLMASGLKRRSQALLRCCDVYGKSASPKVCPLLTAAPSKRDHPPTINPSTGVESMPVLAITLTSRPTERRIYGQLLMAMGASINERLTLMELEIRTVLLLKSNNVRVLVFDEVHNLLAGTPREQRVILQLLRYLSNEIKASLVCLGVSEARDAIAGDTQLARRLDQFVLPRWKADEEFQELVTAILRSLPLRLPSSLSSQSLRHLSRLGDGITARVFGILNELAIEAIQNGIERITDDSIESWRPALEKEAAFA